MPRTKNPRKPRTVRLPCIPITKSLVDEFGMTMHTSLAVLATAPTAEAFDGVGQCLNVIGLALKSKPLLAREHLPVINSGALAMAQVNDRAQRLHRWHVTELELVPIRRAVLTAERLLAKFHVFELYLAMQTLKVAQVAEQQALPQSNHE